MCSWSTEDVQSYQALEKIAQAKSDKGEKEGKRVSWGWTMDLPEMRLMIERYQQIPWWDEAMPTTERTYRSNEFERNIYPAWAGIMERGIASGKSELEIMHECDLAVVGTGHRISRFFADPEKAEKYRHKEAMKSKFKQAMEG